MKIARSNCGRRFAIQKEMTRQSSTTVTVPAAGPYRRTAVKTKASEIEIETCVPGSLTEAEPLISVRNANRIHCGWRGLRSSSTIEIAATASPRTDTSRK